MNGRHPFRAGLLLAALAACGVRDRETLFGRYAARGRPGEFWVLDPDGGCRIERGRTVEACEWEYRERALGTTVVVTIGGAGGRHTRRYVLTPSRWPGQPVTIPLTRDVTLEKVEP